MSNTLNELIKLIQNNKVEELSEKLESLCLHYDLLKNQEWASHFNQPSQIQKKLPNPRIEIRWRDDLVIDNFLNKEIKSAVCDLCLVSVFANKERYDVISCTKSSNINGRLNLEMPGRMEQDAYSLMIQLNLPLFVTYKDILKKVDLPKDHSYLANGVSSLIKKD